MITLDSDIGKELGFTSDKFEKDSYLWRVGNKIVISLIFSIEENKGYLTQLFQGIEDAGYRISVPTPLPKMEAYLMKRGFEMHIENGSFGDYEVWEKPDNGT